MPATYILSLDQGTTSSRAVIFNHEGRMCGLEQKEFPQYFPKPGWVEHDPKEIWSSQMAVASELLLKKGILPSQIDAIGITNQRETTLIWNRNTGAPIYNAIVWQDRRTASYCEHLKKAGYADILRHKTGLEVDAYFSATKIKWLLDNIDGAKAAAGRGELAFGTVDSWLIWKLTGGHHHLTDVTNASRTLLFNIHTLEWDDEILDLLGIPRELLPEVKPTNAFFGETAGEIIRERIPITGVAGDQQAAMFGQQCIREGMVKNTYGTGCFLMMNTAKMPVPSKNRLITTIAWQLNGETTYALEGSVFTAGAVVQWLRDGLGLIKRSSDIEALASQVEHTDGVFFVPAFSGLGAPYWNPDARGVLTGVHRGTTAAHIARAALEAIAFQSNDVMEAMREDVEGDLASLRVDGGAAANNLLMQIQADISQVDIERSKTAEATALGAAFFAGLGCGFWNSIPELERTWSSDRVFTPAISKHAAKHYLTGWHKAVKRSLIV
jgi:glycerol kinase